MAESQIAGLFMTPEMYRQQQFQDDRMRAMQYAQLAPEERANYGFAMAGRGLGRALGTLLGAQDPQLQRITEQQQLLQGLDVANPESLMEAARRASQAGNMPLAMQLAQQANQAVQARDVAEQRQLQMNALKRAAAEQERSRTRTNEAQQLASRALERSQTIYGAPAQIVRDDEGNLMPGAAETSRFNITPEIAARLSATPEGIAVLDSLKKAQEITRPERTVIDNVPYIRDSTGQLSVEPGFVPKQKEPPKLPAKVQEYNFAVEQGFPGTFQNWIDRITPRTGGGSGGGGGGGGGGRRTADIDRTLPVALQTKVNEAIDSAAKYQQQSIQLNTLADSLSAGGGGFGLGTRAYDSVVRALGGSDQMTALRQEYTRVRNGLAIQSLPPGPATDRDIQIALSGFPSPNDDARKVASFLRGMAKMQNISSVIDSAKAEWIENNNGSLGRARTTFTAGDFAANAGETFNQFTARVARQFAEQSRSPLTRAIDQIPGVRAPVPASPQKPSPTMNRADEIIGRGARQ